MTKQQIYKMVVTNHHGGCNLCVDCFGLAELQRDTDSDDTVGGMATRRHQCGHSDEDRGDV